MGFLAIIMTWVFVLCYLSAFVKQEMVLVILSIWGGVVNP